MLWLTAHCHSSERSCSEAVTDHATAGKILPQSYKLWRENQISLGKLKVYDQI